MTLIEAIKLLDYSIKQLTYKSFPSHNGQLIFILLHYMSHNRFRWTKHTLRFKKIVFYSNTAKQITSYSYN